LSGNVENVIGVNLSMNLEKVSCGRMKTLHPCGYAIGVKIKK